MIKRFLLALCAVVALGAGSIGAANALDFGVGPNGVYVGPLGHTGTTITTIIAER